MAYRTRLTVSTAIRETIEDIRTQTRAHDRFSVEVANCVKNLANFVENSDPGPARIYAASKCVELIRSMTKAIEVHFEDLNGRLEMFKAGDRRILYTSGIKLAEDLIRIAEVRQRDLDKFLKNLNIELVEIIYLEFSEGRLLDTIDQFAKVIEAVDEAITKLSTL